MANYRRYILELDGTLSNDQHHPRLNYYSANFFYFERGILEKHLPREETIDVILQPNGYIRAVAADGRIFTDDVRLPLEATY